jgi:cell division protein FtsL
MIERRINNDMVQGNNFSHALTVFTIAAAVACLFTPVFEIGMTHELESTSKDLEKEKMNLIEQRNKLLSQVNQLQTPETIYDLAVKNNYHLDMVTTNL